MVEKLSPDTPDEACAMIAEAASDHVGLMIAGGRTRTIGHPVRHERLLSAGSISGIVDYEPAELVLTVRAGTPVSAVENTLAKAGQRFVFEPMDHRSLLGTKGEPTIGGMVAANVSGPRRILVGACRDSVLGIHFVNGRGELIRSGGRVMKNVTGLDLVKLLCGSWGTLGFITEVTLKALPAPETQATLVISSLTDEEAATTMAVAMGTSAEVSGASHLPESVSGSVLQGHFRGTSATLLRLEGFAESVSIRSEKLAALFRQTGKIVLLDGDRSESLWREIRDCQPFADASDRPVWRVSARPTSGWRIVEELRQLAGADAFYDWQGGLVWLRMEAEPEANALRSLVRRFGGGHATLIRGTDEARSAAPVFHPQSEAVEKLSQRLRRQFDPENIFNPGLMPEAA